MGEFSVFQLKLVSSEAKQTLRSMTENDPYASLRCIIPPVLRGTIGLDKGVLTIM